jgi:hypothetical protein
MAEVVVRVAVIQDCPVPFDLARTVAKVEELTAKAAEAGAELIVFPEAFISGYPKGLDFGARVGMRNPQGRDVFRRYYESALTLNSDECRRLGASAGKAAAHLVIGVIEKDGGTLYCTVLFFGPDGSLLGKHRKTMPTAMERLIWGFGDGSTLTVLDTTIGRLEGRLHEARTPSCFVGASNCRFCVCHSSGNCEGASSRPWGSRPTICKPRHRSKIGNGCAIPGGMLWRVRNSRGRPLNAPAAFIHPCQPIVAKQAPRLGARTQA